MTGFARARSDGDAFSVEVEMRSVNYRYLEVKVRLPSSMASLETPIRNRVASRLGRGKVDVNIRLVPKGETVYELEVDMPLMEEIVRTARRIGSDLGVGGELELSDLMAFGKGFNLKEKDLSGTSKLWEAVEPPIEQALDDLGRMRRAEGEELRADLDKRLEIVANRIDAVERMSESSRERRKRDLLDRVQELASSTIEPSALAMEVARLVERSDVTEEVTRFRSHLTLWKEAAASDEPCGKKLDFILQEMNREVNTIGSKCQDAAMAKEVITIKSDLERIREQVQNIE